MTITPFPLNPEFDLELVREVPVSAEAVFQAWTTPSSLVQWFAPRPFSITACDIDLRPGGGFRTAMADPDGNELFDSTGCYLEVVPNERLAWTSALTAGYRPQPDDLPFTAVLELTPTASGGCTYRALAMHQDNESRNKHDEMGFQQGWGIVVDQLVEHIQATS